MTGSDVVNKLVAAYAEESGSCDPLFLPFIENMVAIASKTYKETTGRVLTLEEAERFCNSAPFLKEMSEAMGVVRTCVRYFT